MWVEPDQKCLARPSGFESADLRQIGETHIRTRACCCTVVNVCGLDYGQVVHLQRSSMGTLNKLNKLTTPYFQSAASLEDVTAIIIAPQITYDTFVETTKSINKAASLYCSASDKLSTAVADNRVKLNPINEYIRNNGVGTGSDKTLKKRWIQFDEGT